MKKALILVDLQNDFMPGGALAVASGDEVIPLANQLQDYFAYVIATQDWHPKDHQSFADNHPGLLVGTQIERAGLTQVLWPVHCVQNTWGAELVKSLNKDRLARLFRKGINPYIDSYSGFFDNGHRTSTGLGDYLIAEHIGAVYVMGLALDYCVKYTVIDACHLGFRTFLIQDACRAINLASNDSDKALEEMKLAGAQVISTRDIIGKFPLLY